MCRALPLHAPSTSRPRATLPSTRRAHVRNALAREDPARAATDRWLRDIIIGYNLCPFAKPATPRALRVEVLRTSDDPSRTLRAVVASECERLLACPRSTPATTLVVLAEDAGAREWDAFASGAVAEAEDVCASMTYGEVTVVPFHPGATFEGESECGNYTARSPYPTVHLLRQCDIDKAEDSWYREEGREDIRLRNAEYLNALGIEELRRAFAAVHRE